MFVKDWLGVEWQEAACSGTLVVTSNGSMYQTVRTIDAVADQDRALAPFKDVILRNAIGFANLLIAE